MFLDYFKSFLGHIAPLYLKGQETISPNNKMTFNNLSTNGYSGHYILPPTPLHVTPGDSPQNHATFDYDSNHQNYDFNTVTLCLNPTQEGHYEIVFSEDPDTSLSDTSSGNTFDTDKNSLLDLDSLHDFIQRTRAELESLTSQQQIERPQHLNNEFLSHHFGYNEDAIISPPINDIISSDLKMGENTDQPEEETINFEALNSIVDDFDLHNVANDIGQSVILHSKDILDMGNNIIITGSKADFIQFEDAGWTKLDNHEHLPEGVTPYEGYDIYVHESGAIVQVESVIPTSFDNHETT